MSEPKCGCRAIVRMNNTYGIAYCSMHEAAEKMLAMLERLEWDRIAKPPGIGRDYERCCGVCDGFESDGHSKACEKAALIVTAKGGR